MDSCIDGIKSYAAAVGIIGESQGTLAAAMTMKNITPTDRKAALLLLENQRNQLPARTRAMRAQCKASPEVLAAIQAQAPAIQRNGRASAIAMWRQSAGKPFAAADTATTELRNAILTIEHTADPDRLRPQLGLRSE